MRVKQAMLVGALVVLTAGCESLSTKTDYDKAFNFGSYHTFSWISKSPLVSKATTQLFRLFSPVS